MQWSFRTPTGGHVKNPLKLWEWNGQKMTAFFSCVILQNRTQKVREKSEPKKIFWFFVWPRPIIDSEAHWSAGATNYHCCGAEEICAFRFRPGFLVLSDQISSHWAKTVFLFWCKTHLCTQGVDLLVAGILQKLNLQKRPKKFLFGYEKECYFLFSVFWGVWSNVEIAFRHHAAGMLHLAWKLPGMVGRKHLCEGSHSAVSEIRQRQACGLVMCYPSNQNEASGQATSASYYQIAIISFLLEPKPWDRKCLASTTNENDGVTFLTDPLGYSKEFNLCFCSSKERSRLFSPQRNQCTWAES